jgi:hypothetical protein
MGLPDSITNTPVAPFSGCTRTILAEYEPSFLAIAARASSRSRRREMRIKVALLQARRCAQCVAGGSVAGSRRPKGI